MIKKVLTMSLKEFESLETKKKNGRTGILELLGLSKHMDGERLVAVEVSVVSSNNLTKVQHSIKIIY